MADKLQSSAEGRDLISLTDFTTLKGCSRRQVYNRLDIPRVKVKGRVYIPRSALTVVIHGRAK